MSFSAMLNLTCRVRTKSQTQSATTGMPVSAYANKTGVRLAFQAMSQGESVQAGGERGEIMFNAYFAHATAVAVGDTIDQIAPGSVWSGRSFSMTSPPIDQTGRAIGYLATAREVGGGAQR